MACDCIEVINANLEPDNTRLVTAIAIASGTPTRVRLAVNKINSNKRGSALGVLATFCPFCGIRYQPKETE